ncbi:MAG TPA: UDP-3-O-(3-hydroxymyristoyl)glucosamine N-acyltransferase [Candidatus Binatus sp.]|jgi:UDP-3-O-[3-hydroxymyristoyl] glucosamine N-acyltransferase|nr:UDP-3-O-(3-hydroxymyristoyl)glucosamine N-acyltransferase [Candidatus Binatus sp.]
MALTASELAEFLGAKLLGDSHSIVSGVALPESAKFDDLIYVESARHQSRAEESAAKCVVAPEGLLLKNKTILVAGNPKLAFAKASTRLLPNFSPTPVIHASAIVASTARLKPHVFVGPYVVIEEEVEIGEGSIVEAFCFLGRGSSIGEKCRLHPRVTLYAGAKLASRVEVHSGAVIGSDGFGYVFGEGRHWKFPQVGTVEVGKDVEIGSNTTIDRGSLGVTRIEAGVKIDNLVQIAHNVSIGAHSIVAAQTGISGSSSLGEGVTLAGQVGIADHCNLEDGTIVGAQGGVPSGKTIRKGQTVWGTPARPWEKFKKQYAALARLPDLIQRIEKIEKAKR